MVGPPAYYSRMKLPTRFAVAVLALAGCTGAPPSQSPSQSPDPTTSTSVSTPAQAPSSPGLTPDRVHRLFTEPLAGIVNDGSDLDPGDLDLQLPGCDLTPQVRSAKRAQKLHSTQQSGPRGFVAAYESGAAAGEAFTTLDRRARECAPLGTVFTDGGDDSTGKWLKAKVGPGAIVLMQYRSTILAVGQRTDFDAAKFLDAYRDRYAEIA